MSLSVYGSSSPTNERNTPVWDRPLNCPFFFPLPGILLAFYPKPVSQLDNLVLFVSSPFLYLTFLLRLSPLGIIMSATGTFRGKPNQTIGRGRLPDFGNDPSASHIPRPRPESSTTNNTPSSDVGSGTMSAASSRQRQNQSKRDEVRHGSPRE